MPASCTPSDNLAIYKCLQCLSVDELLKVWVVVMADAPNSGYTLPDDFQQMINDSACWACLDDKKLLQAAISANAQDIESEATVNSIREKIKCLLCASPRQIKALLAMLICRRGLLPSPPNITDVTFGGAYPNATMDITITWDPQAAAEWQMDLFLGGVWTFYTEGELAFPTSSGGLDAVAAPGTPYRIRTTGDGVQYSGFSQYFTGTIP